MRIKITIILLTYNIYIILYASFQCHLKINHTYTAYSNNTSNINNSKI